MPILTPRKRKKQGASPQPHDALFRYTFSQREHAASLLRAVLPPELVAAVDWRTLRIEKGSFIDDALRGRHSDLVLSARLCGATVYFYTLLEHQRDVEALMMLRIVTDQGHGATGFPTSWGQGDRPDDRGAGCLVWGLGSIRNFTAPLQRGPSGW